MRQSQAQIGVISAPICAFYRHSLGGFSIVSIQSCPVFRILGQNWVRHGAPAPTLSTACMDCSDACKELVGGVEGHPEVGAGVGDAGIAGLSGEAVITVTEVPAVDGTVSQSDGQHGVVPILTQIRILDEGAASRQLPSGEALWVEGAILLQKVQVYILGDGSSFIPQKSRQLYPH